MAAKKETLNSDFVSVVRHPAGALLRLFLIYFLILLTALAIVLSTPRLAIAESPHGPFSSSTDKCGRCHRMHDAKAQGLLTEEGNISICLSCHSKGVGADTAVMEGALIRPTVPGGDVLVAQGTLLGGGFNTLGNTAITSSSHRLGEAGTPFGSDANATVVLTCLSCHTPHQSPNYRLLRRQPTGAGTDISVTWTGPYKAGDGSDDFAYDERDLDSDPSDGTHYLTRNYGAGLAAWCASCHTKYANRGINGSDVVDIGDGEGPQARYRHAVNIPIIGKQSDVYTDINYHLATDLPLADIAGDGRTNDDQIVCLTCHRAHGTDAEMTDPALQVGNRGSLPAGTDSMLLRQDDRKICKSACHKIPD